MRPFNVNNIICINLKQHNLFQIFSISEWYNFDFEILANLKDEVSEQPGEFTGKIWIDLETSEIFAYEFRKLFHEYIVKSGVQKKYWPKKIDIRTFYDGLGVDEILSLGKMRSINTPKIIKDTKTYNMYRYYIERGWDIKNESLDRIIEDNEKRIREKNLLKLKDLLEQAIEMEEYEMAAELRDIINSNTF